MDNDAFVDLPIYEKRWCSILMLNCRRVRDLLPNLPQCFEKTMTDSWILTVYVLVFFDITFCRMLDAEKGLPENTPSRKHSYSWMQMLSWKGLPAANWAARSNFCWHPQVWSKQLGAPGWNTSISGSRVSFGIVMIML